MKRTATNLWIDTISLFVFLFLISTGALMYWVLPPGNRGRWLIWGMNRHEWGEIHLILGIALLILIAVHLVLHWGWIVNAVRGRSQERASKRILFALLLTLLAVVLAVLPLVGPREMAPRHALCSSSLEVRV